MRAKKTQKSVLTIKPVRSFKSQISTLELQKNKLSDIESNNFRPRVTLTAWLAFIILLGVVGRIVSLQLISGGEYSVAAQSNRIRDKIAYAPRGNVYDRNGILLASNQPDFQVSVIPYLLPVDEIDREQVYNKLAEILDLDFQIIKTNAEKEGLGSALPVLIAEHLSHEESLIVEQHLPELQGISVDVVPVRKYKSEAGLAHILGYVARVNPGDLERRKDLIPTDYVGRTGVEAQYDSRLRGENGRSRLEVDAIGRPLKLLGRVNPKNGNDLHLTIDYDLQIFLEQSLRNHMQQSGSTKASAIAMHPKTGEVLAMVSIPFYDNNLFSKGISTNDYEVLINNPDKPLINKVIAGAYPSGSTIKPILASAALQEKVVQPDTVIVDRGQIVVRSIYDPSATFIFRGWRPQGLGPMTATRAIAMSSNIYFYTVGGGHESIKGLGIEKMAHYYREFGLGAKSGIDLPGETAGRVPDPDWKKKAKGENWVLGDTYNTSIGQGDLLVSPLQITLANMTVANGGKLVKPRLIKNAPTVIKREVQVSSDVNAVVREGMRQMIYEGPFGIHRFSNVPVTMAGKTGTAETDKLDPEAQPHAWFVSFAPYDDPEIMLGIMINEGQGSTVAVSPAVETLSYFFSR